MLNSDKQDKKEVKYGPGMKDSHCEMCAHYIRDTASSGICSLVKGRISPQGWCTLYARRKSKQRIKQVGSLWSR